MPHVLVNGINIYYEVHGCGPPLLLIMGLGSDCRHFSMQLPFFSKYYQVIIFDNRGVGRSDAPDGEYSVPVMAQDTLVLLDKLNIKSAHVVGFSLGGYIAQQIALQFPERVNRLVLANTAMSSYPRSKHIQNSFAAALSQGLQHVHHISLLMPWLFSQSFFLKKEQVDFFVTMASMYSQKQSLKGYLGQVAAANAYDSAAVIDQLKMPMLILAAKEDLITPVSCSEAMKNKLPHAELVVLEGLGHCSYIENPQAFNKAIQDFLQNNNLEVTLR